MVHRMFIVAPPTGPLCDFCSCRPVTARYKALTFEMQQSEACSISGLRQGSVGDWAACSDCEKMLDANDWEGIVARAVVYFIKHHPETEAMCALGGISFDQFKRTMKEDFWNLYRQLRDKGFTKAKSAGYD